MGARPRLWGGIAVIVLLVVVGVVMLSTRPAAGPASTTSIGPTHQTKVLVARTDIRSVVVLEGAVTAAPTVPIPSPINGVVTKFLAPANSRVSAGDRIAILTDSEGETRYAAAPEDGILLSIGTALGQPLHAGDAVATLAPNRFQAIATVDPVTLYRLYEPPISVRVQIERGPAPFDCAFVSLGAEVEPGANPFDAPVLFRCAIPRDVRVFAGVRVRIAIVTAEADDVIAVPVETVEGSADQGWVTLRHADGQEERRAVTLGISDGIRIEIRSGLAEGDVILDPPSLGDSGFPSAPE